MPEAPEATESTRPPQSPAGTGGSAFLRDVFDDVQAMWRREFEAAGAGYTPATLTIFRDEVNTGCGTETANIGPFLLPRRSRRLPRHEREVSAGGRSALSTLSHRSRSSTPSLGCCSWSRASASQASTGTTPTLRHDSDPASASAVNFVGQVRPEGGVIDRVARR
jgi:Putative neutral zinc metallopeptidase